MKIREFKKMTQNIKFWLAFFIVASIACSCSKYLDIVPDNTITLEDYFVNRESAYNALSNVYAGIPNNQFMHDTQFLLGDDWLGQRGFIRNQDGLHGSRIMEGLQNTNNPLLSFWDGRNGATHLYQRIRMANTFLDYIHLASDMTNVERKEWIAQVKFLKAYFHFILIQHYGPIVIVDKNLPLNTESGDLFVRRAKIDECFNYVIELMDEAIRDLDEGIVMENNLGMVHKSAAKAIKARVMLFRASPLFNGPSDLFKGFLDHDNKPFFPMDAEGSQAWTKKWTDAETAINEAIEQCEKDGFGLYQYEGLPYKFDTEVWRNNHDVMKLHYTLRLVIVDPWNKECIWGRTYRTEDGGTLQEASNLRLPAEFTMGVTETNSNSWNWGGATYQAMNRYYTKHGLPVEADKTFDKVNMYRMIITPEEDAPEYAELQGIMQPEFMTVKMYMDREPRFYANLGVSGGYWRSHQFLIPLEMYGGTAGGYDARWREDFYWTGIGVKKFVHPESKSGHSVRQTHFPYPIIRMADLYLMKAEILNQLNGPGKPVWDEINKIRRRAGIPDVEKVWADGNLVNSLYINRHLDQEGMHEIIMRERAIELSFEGSRYWDVVRHKRGTVEFNTPVTGWTGNAYGALNFFRLEVKQRRQFLNRNYFWPISLNELNTNGNMIQTYGWDSR